MSKRDAYLEKFKAQLDAWNAELDKLESKARKASADMQTDYDEQLRELRRRRDRVREQYRAMEQSGEKAWDEFRVKAEAAWKDLEEGFRKAWSRF